MSYSCKYEHAVLPLLICHWCLLAPLRFTCTTPPDQPRLQLLPICTCYRWQPASYIFLLLLINFNDSFMRDFRALFSCLPDLPCLLWTCVPSLFTRITLCPCSTWPQTTGLFTCTVLFTWIVLVGHIYLGCLQVNSPAFIPNNKIFLSIRVLQNHWSAHSF